MPTKIAPPNGEPRRADAALATTLATYVALKRVPVIPEPAALLISAGVGIATFLFN